jgi:hypothetical protein
MLKSDRLRYAAANVVAIPKYGSVEFRSMAGNLDPDRVQKWVNMLIALRDFNVASPDMVPAMLSAEGPAGLAARIFGREVAQTLDIDTDMCYDALRYIQPALFARKWVDNPFGDIPPDPREEQLGGRVEDAVARFREALAERGGGQAHIQEALNGVPEGQDNADGDDDLVLDPDPVPVVAPAVGLPHFVGFDIDNNAWVNAAPNFPEIEEQQRNRLARAQRVINDAIDDVIVAQNHRRGAQVQPQVIPDPFWDEDENL